MESLTQIDQLLASQLCLFFKNINLKIKNKDFEVETNKQKLMKTFLDNYVTDHPQYHHIDELKEYIFDQLPQELIHGNKYHKKTIQRFFVLKEQFTVMNCSILLFFYSFNHKKL